MVFAREAFGALPAFVVGWIAYVSAVASAAAVIVGLTTAVGPAVGVDGPIALRVAATVLAGLLAALCAQGLRLSARTWTALTALKLVPLVALAVVFLVAPGAPSPAPPLLPAGDVAPSLAGAALIATFAFQGFEIVPVMAGQARRPAFSVPMATLGSLAVAAVLYVVLQAACEAALPHLAASRAPLVDAAFVHGGPGLAAFVGAGTSISALGIAFGMMAATPFYLTALARVDGLGMGIAVMDGRGVAPRALFVTWALVTLLIQAGGRGELFALSSIAVLSQYLVTAAAMFALARRGQRGLGRRHAALALPAGIVAAAIAAGASPREAGVAAAALVVGLALRAGLHRARR